jgi:hypothetical protein
MGKSDEKETKKRAHKATDGESKHKKQPSVNALGSKSSIFETPFQENDGGLRHSQWRHHFQHVFEYNVKFGNCRVPYSTVMQPANPKLGTWVAKQRHSYKRYQEGKPNHMTPAHTRALQSIPLYVTRPRMTSN